MSNGWVPVSITGCITLDASADPFLDGARQFLHHRRKHHDRLVAAIPPFTVQVRDASLGQQRPFCRVARDHENVQMIAAMA